MELKCILQLKKKKKNAPLNTHTSAQETGTLSLWMLRNPQHSWRICLFSTPSARPILPTPSSGSSYPLLCCTACSSCSFHMLDPSPHGSSARSSLPWPVYLKVTLSPTPFYFIPLYVFFWVSYRDYNPNYIFFLFPFFERRYVLVLTH